MSSRWPYQKLCLCHRIVRASLPSLLAISRKLAESVSPRKTCIHSLALLSGSCITRAPTNWLLSAIGTGLPKRSHLYRVQALPACPPVSKTINSQLTPTPSNHLHHLSCVCVCVDCLYVRKAFILVKSD